MQALFAAALLVLGFQSIEPEYDTFFLKSGGSIQAKVLGIQGDKVNLLLSIMGGTAETQRSLSDFTPYSSFLIQAIGAKPDSFDDHFRLARLAAENGLVAEAGHEAGLAKQITDKSPNGKAQFAELRKWAADALEKAFGVALQKQDYAQARHFLTVMMSRTPEERTADQKNALFARLHQAENQYKVQREKASEAREASIEAQNREAKLAPMRKQLEEGNRLNESGLAQANSPGDSMTAFESAISSYKAAWAGVEQILKSGTKDTVMRSEASEMAEQIQENAIEAGLNAAHVLTARTDYNGAMKYVNRVLAFDPKNADALDLRKTIELASAGGWGWGWGGAAAIGVGRAR